jgi:hypothetical protein
LPFTFLLLPSSVDLRRVDERFYKVNQFRKI